MQKYCDNCQYTDNYGKVFFRRYSKEELFAKCRRAKG